LSGLYLSTPSMRDWMTSGREAGTLETRAIDEVLANEVWSEAKEEAQRSQIKTKHLC
jgi:hypothetical protein